MGGMVAMKLMADHPDRVLSGALCGMGWLRDGSPLQAFWSLLPDRGGAGTPPACLRGIAKLAVTEEAIRGIRVPVAVLVGARDPVKALYVEPLARIRKDWPVTEIPACGHLNCTFSDRFKQELLPWLDENAQPEPARPPDPR